MSWCEASPAYADDRYTFITTNAQAVAWYEELLRRHPLTPGVIAQLRGCHLVCRCRVTEPCHGDTLLRLVNQRSDAERRST